MKKRILISMFVALAFGMIQPMGAMATDIDNIDSPEDEVVEIVPQDTVKITNSGQVSLISNHAELDNINTLQLSLQLDSDIVIANAYFNFEEINAKVATYRYKADSNQINIYISGTKNLFIDDSDGLVLGTVVAEDEDGYAIPVKLSVVEDSLKYVYLNQLQVYDVTTEIEPAPETTAMTQTTTTTAMIQTTTTTAKTETTTTTAKSETTTTTTKPETTITTAKPETTTTTAKTEITTTTAKPETSATTTTTQATTEPVATTEAPTSHVASNEEFCEWAINDYQDKTGVTPANAEITEISDTQYEITLTDNSGAVLDKYSINPNTGVGTNSNNEEINLPQTGNNSMRNLCIAIGAFVFAGIGFYAVKTSGVIRRKENN